MSVYPSEVQKSRQQRELEAYYARFDKPSQYSDKSRHQQELEAYYTSFQTQPLNNSAPPYPRSEPISIEQYRTFTPAMGHNQYNPPPPQQVVPNPVYNQQQHAAYNHTPQAPEQYSHDLEYGAQAHLDHHDSVDLRDQKQDAILLEIPRSAQSKPWRSRWNWNRNFMTFMYIGLLASYVVYLYFRIRYTLKVASDRKDNSSQATYGVSVYSIVTLVVEVCCMAAMALYAVNKTYYPMEMWLPPGPRSVKAPFRVKICVCCYKEDTNTLAGTFKAAAHALEVARSQGLIAPESAIWLCDDTPAPKFRGNAFPETEKKECEYTANGLKFRHTGTMRDNRMELILNMREAYPTIQFMHRSPTAASRVAEVNGLNKKSGNLNSTIKELWPAQYGVDDRDVMVVLDADQAAFPDFLTNLLPCLDAGVPSDNVALVQSPQVFEGVHPVYDVFNHQNVEFWSTMMVAYNTTGFISCAGTNFAIRAAALRSLGPSPFPTHTVTEDFALGMRLRAHNPPFTGIYLPLQLVEGTAPDTIRAAFKQRSRWTKGPFQMMFSRESALWFTPPPGAPNLTGLSFRDRIGFLGPVFNATVNSFATPFYCAVPIVFIWFGYFPAALTLATIIAALVTILFVFFFKFVAHPSLGVRIVKRNDAGQPLIGKDNKVERRQHGFLSYILAEWNADVNIRNFWWLFVKVIGNFFLRLVGLRRQAGFSATVGGVTNVFDGFLDIFPLFLLWLVLMASVTWAALQFYVGARFLGPLGITAVYAIYQAVPPFAMMCYVLFRVRHVPRQQGCCWCYEHWGRAVFSFIYLGLFVLSWACLVIAAILAVKTFPRQTAFTQNIRTFDKNGQEVTYHYFYSVKTTFELLKSNLHSGKNWEWHW